MRLAVLLKKFLPRSGVSFARHLNGRLRVWTETFEDGLRHYRYGGVDDSDSGRLERAKNLEAQIIKDYHRVEKGLALRAPKASFGREVRGRLRRDISRYVLTESYDPGIVDHARQAVAGLDQWNGHGVISEDLTKPAKQADFRDRMDAESFFASRSSVRDFEDRAVDPALIESAAGMALASPSVCNRQAWGLLAYHEREQIEGLAALQNGNSGFRSDIPCLLIVTTDTRLFCGAGERNQRWIDGGLYAMTLVWSLHAQGLGSCMLNWSVGNSQSRRLRRAAGIPNYMDVIMMIAVGWTRDGALVARSPRRSVEQVLRRA